jgi:hypothetical protein
VDDPAADAEKAREKSNPKARGGPEPDGNRLLVALAPTVDEQDDARDGAEARAAATALRPEAIGRVSVTPPMISSKTVRETTLMTSAPPIAPGSVASAKTVPLR